MNVPSPISQPSSKLKMNSFVQSNSSFRLANSSPKKLENRNPQDNGLKRKALASRDTNKKHTKISKDWMEYQGINGWEGLLDPLDDNLRSEILRYGDFVEATYRSFDFNPSSPTYATCKYPKSSLLTRSGIRCSGYRVTRNLNATCGVELPAWPVRVPSWMSTRSSWIGYVAVCHDRREISRLGRRDVVIAFRGTGTCLEWIENLRAALTCLHGSGVDDGPMVQSGFLSLYSSKASKRQSLQDTVREEVRRIIRMYGEKPLSFTITGHSLGAALATLAAYDIHNTFADAPMVTVISFGGPRVGNKSLGCLLEKSGTNILRIVNSDDLITKVPGFVIDNNNGTVDHRDATNAPGLPGWLNQRMQDSQWLYADIGRELRLSSKDCPYLYDINVATCHELKTYLQLVSGFVSSKCPFRATAKKVLSMRSHGSRS
ncbi:phospholipase A(1) DAD1, chloroplastic-like [Punica granatum]|uniref:Phospholipase A(1) DAD1, chloroplastic-like n=1 Tax=Punica granatum TaxID=22663 RepID=A0A6P8D1C4_PUNGR|nr:phospholipase A(1) DAD1, chloroplastic-like [Punica granatum]